MTPGTEEWYRFLSSGAHNAGRILERLEEDANGRIDAHLAYGPLNFNWDMQRAISDARSACHICGKPRGH